MTQGFELSTNAQQKLVLKREGHPDVVDVRLRRSFPWSNADHFISLRSSEGKELLLIEDANELDPPTKALVKNYLAQTIFIPRITRIETIDVRFGYQQWSVQTDRGPAQFRVQEREDIRFLPDGRYSIRDADGTIYELPKMESLDEHSRKSLAPLI